MKKRNLESRALFQGGVILSVSLPSRPFLTPPCSHRSFNESMHSLKPDKPWQTKLSSAGLVYVHFGSQILANKLGLKEEDPVVCLLYDKVSRSIFGMGIRERKCHE